MMPPNSHGEANPADRDPVPPPFDNTYNSPEHDAFVIKVKYQRTDDFFTKNMVDGADRAALEHAWTDLFGSWPYHDAYLGMLLDHFDVKTGSRKIADMTPARIAALPAALQAAREEAEGALRHDHGDDEARPARARRRRAWRSPAGPGAVRSPPAEQAGLRGFYRTSRTTGKLSHEGAIRAHAGARADVAGVPLPGRVGAARHRDHAQRLGDGQPHELLPVVVDSRRGAAPGRRREGAERPEEAGGAGRAHDRRPEGAAPVDRVLRPVARLLPLRRVPRRRHRPLPRVHRRRQPGDVRGIGRDLRVPRSASGGR